MTIPSYTVESQRPRLWWRNSDLATIQARVGVGGSWETEYVNEVDAYVQSVRNDTAASIINGESSPQENLLAIALVAHVDNDSALMDLGIAVALALINDSYHTSSSDRWRDRAFALAIAFDAFYNDMTSGERSTIASEVETSALDMSQRIPQELMTGHSGLEQVAAIHCGLALHGYDTPAANSILNSSMRFWFGDDVPLPSGGTGAGRIAQMRHITSDGGSVWSHYHFRNHTWEIGWLFHVLSTATNYNAWTDPANSTFLDTWEWLLWMVRGGTDRDPEAFSDFVLTTAPTMNRSRAMAFVQQWVHASERQAQIRWLYDEHDGGDRSRETHAFDIVLGEKYATSTSPAAATPTIPTERLFDPPGMYYFRQAPSGQNDWDYDNSVVYRVSGREFYMMEHTHLDTGAVAMRFNGDPLILSPSGNYDDFGGAHGINVYHASSYQSGVPLVHDSSESWQWFSQGVVNDGGHQRKKYIDDPWRSPSRPYTVDYMLNDAGGEAWRQTNDFELVDSNADYSYLHLDNTPCYRLLHTDTPKATVLIKYMIIKVNGSNGLAYPALLYFARITKADADFPTYVAWHHRTATTSTAYGWTAEGGEQSGKVWVDFYDIANYERRIELAGTLDANGWGDNQFEQPFGSGTNYKPTQADRARIEMNTKRESVWCRKFDLDPVDDCLFLFMPTARLDSEPATGRVWINETDWYGIDFGGGQEYRLHKTAKLAQGPAGGADTTPPGEVSGVVTTPADGQVTLQWTNPGDADLDKVCIRHRVKNI